MSLSPPISAALDELQREEHRTLVEFAEEEVVVPTGPRAGLRFNTNFAPWTAPVLREYHSPRWSRNFARGAVQSGKTLVTQNIPLCYHICEIREDVIFGAPSKDLATDVFYEKVKPILESSGYGWIWPDTGPGSRGGEVDSLRLKNGVTVRFRGAGGRPTQRSSHTVRVVVLTELDKMDTVKGASRETDPIRQFEARTVAYGEDALIYGECTTTTEQGRIYQETDENGSGTRIHLRCPYCGHYVYPDRSNLVGWRNADSVLEAADNARYQCQHCEQLWDEDDRSTANSDPLLIHKTQQWDTENRQVTGEVPATDTFGVVYNFMHSPLTTMAEVAKREWRADQQGNPESAERELCQHHWAIPYEPQESAEQTSYRMLAEHAGDYHFDPLCTTDAGQYHHEQRTQIPEAADIRIGTIDVQKRWIYWLVDGYDRDLTCWTLAYSVEQIIPDEADWDPTEQHVRRALDSALARMERYQINSLWVDTGYRHDCSPEHVLRTWCSEQGPSVHALVGRSAGHRPRKSGRNLQLPAGAPDMMEARRQKSGRILWFFEVDQLKDDLHFRLFRERGSPGYHYFPREAANAKRNNRAPSGGHSVGWIFKHIMNSRREVETKKGSTQRRWVESGRVDLWDCMTYSLGGAYLTRAELEAREQQQAESTDRSGTSEGDPVEDRTSIRTNY